ncbi:hypothetical protein [Kordiimonas aquimaris]|uniref:hypothetical protein n=1 Tax=Kordiimonas aquimaris TaxID=707591 RepID=UPI0021D2F78B|nr:hypothetical protein [Kordiimonas aquimaris]
MRRSFAKRRNQQRACALDLHSLPRTELDAIAQAKGIPVSPRWKDETVIRYIKAAS